MNKAKMTLVASVAIAPLVMFSGAAVAASAHNEQTGAHNSDVWDSGESAWSKQQPDWERMNTRVQQLDTRAGTAQGLRSEASPPAADAAPAASATPAAASGPASDDVKFLLNRR